MAKLLYEAETDLIKETYEAAATQQHKEALAKHNTAKTGVPSTDPEEQEK